MVLNKIFRVPSFILPHWSLKVTWWSRQADVVSIWRTRISFRMLVTYLTLRAHRTVPDARAALGTSRCLVSLAEWLLRVNGEWRSFYMNAGVLIPSSTPRCRVKTDCRIRSTYFCEYLNKVIRIIATFIECLLCAWHFSKCFIHINSFNPHNHFVRT